MQHRDITDEQWLTMMRECPPDARVVGHLGTSVAVRRKDGTGILVSPDGSYVEVDEAGHTST